MPLSAVETRVLGCLLEKERTTPDIYPLTLNSLITACNQTSNREPIVSFDEKTVAQGLDSLRERKLATVIFGAGSRVQKYRHNLLESYDLDPREVAILCVLLLRGPQTPGELRARSERMCGALTLADVEKCLGDLATGSAPLIRMLPTRPGQKEKRYAQLLSGEPDLTETFARSAPSALPTQPSRIELLEHEIAALKSDLQNLREEFAVFRRQFE